MRRVRRRLLHAVGGALILLAGATIAAPAASAHPMPHSIVTLDVRESSIDATVELPFSDLGLATGLDLDVDDPLSAVGGELGDYVREHTRLTSEDGRAWDVEVTGMSISSSEQTDTGTYDEFVVDLLLTPPDEADTRVFTFAYDAIIHQVITHKILVTVRDDWSSGAVDGAVQQVGVIAVDTATGQVAPLQVDLGAGSMWAGFLAMMHLGGTHILEGTDHLLFLLVLLIPAPLIAAAGRWRHPVGVRRSGARMLAITIAFTIGHALTLALSTLTRLRLLATPIEALIAVSILVGAIHALRPLFPGREPLVAGLFGLVHGLAFSFTLAELDLSTPQLIVSLLGFNLGIELLQFAVVLCVLPALVILAPWRGYTVIRVVTAVAAAIGALGWLADRLGAPNIVATIADSSGRLGGWAALGLWTLALAQLISRRRGRRSPGWRRTHEEVGAAAPRHAIGVPDSAAR